jgi:hypothetical protein
MAHIAVYPSGFEVELHPFVTLEAMVENIQTAVLFVKRGDNEAAVKRLEETCIQVFAKGLFEQLIVLLPKQYYQDEGEMPGYIWDDNVPTIVERVEEAQS